MIDIPFWCPSCQRESIAKADPLGLLFGGAVDFRLTCENCGAAHRAKVSYGNVGQTIKLLGSLEPETED